MIARHLSFMIRAIGVFLGGSLLLLLHASVRLEAQSAPPFLISPYYGAVVRTNEYSDSHPAYDFGLNHAHVLLGASGVIERVRWFT